MKSTIKKNPIVYVFLSFLLIVSFTNCNTTKFNFLSNTKVGILGIEGNVSIYSVDDDFNTNSDNDGIISVSIAKMLGSDNPEIITAQDRIDYAEEYLRYSLENMANIQVVDKETVFQNQIYQNSNGTIFSYMETNIPSKGYKKSLLSLGSKKTRMLLKDIKADYLVSASFEFCKHLIKENNTTELFPVVKMNVHVFDANGREVVRKTYLAESSNSVKVEGTYDKNAFVELFPEVTETVINKFIVDYL